MPLALILSNWRSLLIVGMALACVALWWRADYLSGRVDSAERINALYAKQAPILKAERDRALARAVRAEKLKGDIANAEDGSVAPALRVALDGLRNSQSATGSH